MTFDLQAILIFTAAAIIYSSLLPARWRGWALLIGSVIAIAWLQPPLLIRFSDYILPMTTIALTVLTWWFIRKPNDEKQAKSLPEDRLTLGIIILLVVGLALNRYVDAGYRLTASRPPPPLVVLAVIALTIGVLVGLSRIVIRWLNSLNSQERSQLHKRALTVVFLVIVVMFVLLKTEPFAEGISRWWRSRTGRDPALATAFDLGWLGFSFVAFRLLHVVRDRQTGILPSLSLRQFASYVLFFPAFTAGPIDRAERFLADYQRLPSMVGMDPVRFGRGLWRISLGLFKKFIVADGLAHGLALTTANAGQATSTWGLWLLLYGYALRLYLDFAGYSDIAIGLGMLYGIQLPENFSQPYLKTDITKFWQSWHMTLSSWARFYVFSPLSRWLLTRSWRPRSMTIVLIAQLATMVVIGLWHGVTVNFFIWGLWHGLGLFIHKAWSDRTRKWYRSLVRRPRSYRAWTFFGWIITFHYIALGWVWFALPDVNRSLDVFARLFALK